MIRMPRKALATIRPMVPFNNQLDTSLSINPIIALSARRVPARTAVVNADDLFVIFVVTRIEA